MPKKAKGLTARQVETMKTPGDHADGNGLYMRVKPSGMKTWLFRYQVNGHRHAMGLGSTRLKSLAQAREKSYELALKISDGIDPIQERKVLERKTSITFMDAAARYIKVMSPSWKNVKHAQQWQNTLDKYCIPIADLPVDKIDSYLVMQCLEPIWAVIPETASRIRGRMEKILDWSRVNGYREGENPARWSGHLDQSLPRKTKIRTVKGHASMPYTELPQFWPVLNLLQGLGARALEFTILTACRTSEVLNAKWQEIDEPSQIWTIPAERMKAGKEHRVPLSNATLSLLNALKNQQRGDLIFPGQKRNQPLSNMTMLKVLQRLEHAYTPHGFRSTFRTWISEKTNHVHEVAEAALAHTIGDKVVAAYQRGDLFEKRRQLMLDWTNFVNSHK
jgi:integrase